MDLATLALTRADGGPIVPYRARIEPSPRGPVLVIVGTPGRWELETARSASAANLPLAIDLGQRWVLHNLGDLLDEADELIEADALLTAGVAS